MSCWRQRHNPPALPRLAAVEAGMWRGQNWCVLWMLCCAAPAWAAKAHEHGTARLDITVETGRITLQLEMPLDVLLGFERPPRSDAERQRADAAVARLRAAGGLFRIDAAAGCTLASVELASAALKLGAAPAAARPVAGSAVDTHAEIDANISFTCQAGAQAGFIDTELFSAFDRLARLDVQVAGMHGQRQTTLQRPAKRVALKR
jgi:hypothetical protein